MKGYASCIVTSDGTSLHQWLIEKGFAPFIEFGNPIQSYENKTLNRGGIRIEICDDVASVWMPSNRYAEHVETVNLRTTIDKLLCRNYRRSLEPIKQYMVKTYENDTQSMQTTIPMTWEEATKLAEQEVNKGSQYAEIFTTDGTYCTVII